MTIDNEQLAAYEKNLQILLMQKCMEQGMLGGQLLQVDEAEEVWDKMAPEYMADAVPQIKEYPAVAIAWAGYVGMAIASVWDTKWEHYRDMPDLYAVLRDPRGFDEMDEFIVEDVLGISLESAENQKIIDMMRSCANTALTMIRNEQFEAQSSAAFYVYASTTRIMFRIGVALELHRLGYKYEKAEVEMPVN